MFNWNKKDKPIELNIRTISPKKDDIIVIDIDIGNMSHKKAIEYMEGIQKVYESTKENDNETLVIGNRTDGFKQTVSAESLYELIGRLLNRETKDEE
jgi:hypothetical protein